jgi:3'(2'), 5'-bisphosphate nucleotidase
VTLADKTANKLILDGIRRNFLEDIIVSEECETDYGVDDYTRECLKRVWYIDPLDGTRGFINRTDQFAVHIGLAVGHFPVLGVVYKPVSGECYYGVKGRGAYLVNPQGLSKKISVGPGLDEKLRLVLDKEALVDEKWKPLLEGLKSFGPFYFQVSGSEGLRIMKIAEGLADLHTNNRADVCSTWDLCAPQIIAEEAGAIVRYICGRRIRYHEQRKLENFFVVARTESNYELMSHLISGFLV